MYTSPLITSWYITLWKLLVRIVGNALFEEVPYCGIIKEKESGGQGGLTRKILYTGSKNRNKASGPTDPNKVII
jgi:hypothetical protein